LPLLAGGQFYIQDWLSHKISIHSALELHSPFCQTQSCTYLLEHFYRPQSIDFHLMVGKKKKNQALHVINQTSQRFCRVSDSDTREFSPTSKIENANGGELNHDYTVDQVSSSINELPHSEAFATF